MPLPPPPPPSITPRQMHLLRVVTSMAWSDGELAEEEVKIVLDRFSRLFPSQSEQQKQQLQQELYDYMMQNIPLEESIPKLATQEERELVLTLGYEVITSSSRTPDEPKINAEEAAAYQKLIQLLGLPIERVRELEAEVENTDNGTSSLIDKLTNKLQSFMED